MCDSPWGWMGAGVELTLTLCCVARMLLGSSLSVKNKKRSFRAQFYFRFRFGSDGQREGK